VIEKIDTVILMVGEGTVISSKISELLILVLAARYFLYNKECIFRELIYRSSSTYTLFFFCGRDQHRY